jgi:hypothetical protein
MVRIANNSTMVHEDAIEHLNVEINNQKFVIPKLWAINQPSHDIIIGNNFQRLYSPCTQTIQSIIFTLNKKQVEIRKLKSAVTSEN